MAQSQHSASLFKTDLIHQLKDARIAIVYTEWNDRIVAEQVRGCEAVANSFSARIIAKAAVPGSFELPFGCRRLWNHYELFPEVQRPEAIIAFGAVIRGGTPHFDYVCKAVTEGITELNLKLPVPVIFGVLTLDDEQQAWDRLGGPHGHKGEEAALTALKMIRFNRGSDFL